MSKHTPGKWIVGTMDKTWMPIVNSNGLIADVRVKGVAEAEANARLIAAAPDLLREAKGVLEAFDMEGETSQLFFDWITGLRAAVDKAEGRQSA